MRGLMSDSRQDSELLHWGVELELFNGKCLYLSANAVIADAYSVNIEVNENNVIAVPKSSVRKLLVMCSGEQEKD